MPGTNSHHLLVTLNAHDWNQPCYHGRGIIPVHSLVHAGVFELAIHSWDIRSALASSAHLSPDALAAMLDFFAECPHWCFLPAARLSTPIRYRFAFTGALSGQWDIVVEGDTAHIGPSADATPAHATFACERETFALLICGRIGFDTAMDDKRLIPTGDMAVAQAFKKWFQGV
jgi:SCP-2 sterol transfer family